MPDSSGIPPAVQVCLHGGICVKTCGLGHVHIYGCDNSVAVYPRAVSSRCCLAGRRPARDFRAVRRVFQACILEFVTVLLEMRFRHIRFCVCVIVYGLFPLLHSNQTHTDATLRADFSLQRCTRAHLRRTRCSGYHAVASSPSHQHM